MIHVVQYLNIKESCVGWREWVAFPNLGIKKIKAKIDTGARTSVLHAVSISPFRSKNKLFVRFIIHPIQRNRSTKVICESEVIDQRHISDSSGHREFRYVIQTLLTIGGRSWPIELTLSNRDTMNFRLLLGRTAIKNHFYVDPSHSFYQKK